MLKGLFFLLTTSTSLVYSAPANHWVNQKNPLNIENRNKSSNTDKNHHECSKPKYGYFYSTKPEIIANDQSIPLFHSTQNHSGIYFDIFDSKSINIQNSGKYYVSWEIFVENLDESQKPNFSLHIFDNYTEGHKILPSLQGSRKKDHLKVTGATIIDVPESGTFVQLKNESGFSVTTALDNDSLISTEGFSATANLLICEFNPSLNGNIQLSGYQKLIVDDARFSEIEATTLKQSKNDKINETLIEGNIVTSTSDNNRIIDIFKKNQFSVSYPFKSTLLGETNSVIHYRGHKNIQNVMQEIKYALEFPENFE